MIQETLITTSNLTNNSNRFKTYFGRFKILFNLIIVLASINGFSQTLQKGWSTFSGKIENTPVIVSIFNEGNGILNGDYCYIKYENRIVLKGKINGNEISLEEFIENHLNAKFIGKINEEDNTIKGKWRYLAKNTELPFSLNLLSWTGGSLKNKYSFSTSNEVVEAFFKKIKQSILTNDKIWLSKNIHYPINIDLNNKKLKISNQSQFLNNYSKITTENLKIKNKNSCVCDIFSNWQGAMFADGLIWINEYNGKLKISAINN